MAEVIYVDFSPEFQFEVFMSVKQLGFDRTMKWLLSLGFKDTVCKAYLRNIMRNKGW